MKNRILGWMIFVPLLAVLFLSQGCLEILYDFTPHTAVIGKNVLLGVHVKPTDVYGAQGVLAIQVPNGALPRNCFYAFDYVSGQTDTLARKWGELTQNRRIDDSLTAHFPPRTGYKWIGAVTIDAIKGDTLAYYDGVINFRLPPTMSEGDYLIDYRVGWSADTGATVAWTDSLLEVPISLIPEVKIEEESDFHPTSMLRQNAPNPFNRGTTIDYEISHPGAITLKIYDVSGKLIKTLVNGHKESGTETVYWDGIDDNGNAVASGTYISILEIDNSISSRKMILLK